MLNALRIGMSVAALMFAAQAVAATAATTPGQAVEARITSLKTALQITPEEGPAWSVFAQAMRDNATSTDALFSQRASRAASMSALDNMNSYAEVAHTYADDTQKLATAFGVLYGQLSDSQKHAADAVFRDQSAAK